MTNHFWKLSFLTIITTTKVLAPTNHPVNMPRKRKLSFFCSMCMYSCSKATSLQNHKRKCKDIMDVMDTNEIVNNNVEQVTETNIT